MSEIPTIEEHIDQMMGIDRRVKHNYMNVVVNEPMLRYEDYIKNKW